jgi:hypothetical protein
MPHKHRRAGMSPGSVDSTGECIKRLVYAVAGVLALSPLVGLASVSAPASAAVQHPAAAEATCADQSDPRNFFDGTADGGYLYESGGELFSNNTTSQEWCYETGNALSGGGNYFLMREQGTDNCAELDVSLGSYVYTATCDVSKLAQNWAWNDADVIYNQQTGTSACLTSNKDVDSTAEPVFMVSPAGGCLGTGGQVWTDVFPTEPLH